MRIVLNKYFYDLTSARVFRYALVALVTALVGCTHAPVAPPVPAHIQVEPSAPPVKRIGLALGGGAARGFAHIGVIQALEDAGIHADLVVGTSAGSLVAALYASGKTGVDLQRLALSMEESTFADWTLPLFNRGLLRGEALSRYVSAQVGGRLIEQMPLPLGIVATDLRSGQGVLFRRGDTATAVRASSAIPALFEPVRVADREFVDGGLVAPVPVRYAREMGADLVIAVDISAVPDNQTPRDTLQVLLQTVSIMIKSINQFELRQADIVVRPALAGIASSDFGARRQAIEAGRVAMHSLLPDLRAAMLAKRPP